MNNKSQEKLPYIQRYIYALECWRKEIDDLYIYFLGCQMEEKSSTFCISKWSPWKVVSQSLLFYWRCRLGACIIRQETPTQVPCCEFCKIFKYTFFFWNSSGRLFLIIQSSNSNYGTIHSTTPFISFKQFSFQVNIKFQITGFCPKKDQLQSHN